MATAHPIPTDPRFQNLTGKRFGRLTVLNYAGRNSGSSLWNCVCDCGKTTVSAGSKLRSKLTASCGCLGLENRIRSRVKHGHASTLHRLPEYAVWKTMKARCYCTTNRQYPDYGGRGITICDRWLDSFANFIADMGPRPSAKYGIDRIDNDGNYEPSNCRWATGVEQGRNKRNNHLLTHNGKTMCLSAWAEELGLKAGVILARLYRRRPIQDVLFKGSLRYR